VPGERAGPASLACRTSSLVQWTYTNLYQKLRIPAHPVGVCGFCLTGNSGGAAAITYAISRYGLSSIVDAAIPSSGPPLASIEKGCTMLQADSAYWYEGWARALIDGAYGYAGAGPCATNSTSFATRWEADGVNDGGQYSLPTTRVHFIFGGADTSEAVAHGKDYLRLLTDSGSPLVSSETVPGMPHDISDSTAGLAALTAAITWTPPSVTPVPSPRASPTATPRVLPTSTPLPRATPSPSATATRSTPTPTPRPTRTPTRVFESPR
jgi:hypothetical protein